MATPELAAFFSYSREDSEFALRLAGDLKAAGALVWLDQLDITPGQRWDRAIEDALNNCPRMLVILSPASVNSTNVMDEVSFALESCKTVIPIVFRECVIPFRLRRVQYVDFKTDYAGGLKELLKTLDTKEPSGPSASETSGASKMPVPQPPSQKPPQPSALPVVPPPPPPSFPAPAQERLAVSFDKPRPGPLLTQPPRSKFPVWAILVGSLGVLLMLGLFIAGFYSAYLQSQKSQSKNGTSTASGQESTVQPPDSTSVDLRLRELLGKQKQDVLDYLGSPDFGSTATELVYRSIGVEIVMSKGSVQAVTFLQGYSRPIADGLTITMSKSEIEARFGESVTAIELKAHKLKSFAYDNIISDYAVSIFYDDKLSQTDHPQMIQILR